MGLTLITGGGAEGSDSGLVVETGALERLLAAGCVFLLQDIKTVNPISSSNKTRFMVCFVKEYLKYYASYR
jgi:hypothetical protein